MSHELICTWLGLPCDGWPPDHYRLLGLEPGATDRARIEQQVQQRLETVRRYQLTHPEPATEAMNRLAQAFVCLTNAQAKKAYDASLFPKPAGFSEPSPPTTAEQPAAIPVAVETATDRRIGSNGSWNQPAAEAVHLTPLPPPTEIQWSSMQATDLDRAVPVRQIVSASDPVPIPPPTPDAPRQANTPPPSSILDFPAPVEPDKADTVIEMAQTSARARRGLDTKRALYHRMARTRQLLRVWERAGKILGHPKRRVTKPTQATALMQQLQTLRTLLRAFPPLVGEAGQPGYLVLSLARQPMIVPTLKALLPSQREALARDWQAGQKFLTAHVQFLRAELLAMRRESPWRWAMRAVRTFIAEDPAAVLLLLALLALGVALFNHFMY